MNLQQKEWSETCLLIIKIFLIYFSCLFCPSASRSAHNFCHTPQCPWAGAVEYWMKLCLHTDGDIYVVCWPKFIDPNPFCPSCICTYHIHTELFSPFCSLLVPHPWLCLISMWLSIACENIWFLQLHFSEPCCRNAARWRSQCFCPWDQIANIKVELRTFAAKKIPDKHQKKLAQLELLLGIFFYQPYQPCIGIV